MNESHEVQNFISLNESKSLSIHQAALNSIFIFSELKEDQDKQKSTIENNIEQIQSLIAQLEYEQNQCQFLSREIEIKKQNYYKFKAKVEHFIFKEEENEKKELQQQEKHFISLNDRAVKLISKTRQMLKNKDSCCGERGVNLRRVF